MQCRRCGAHIHSELEICPHCGARQKRQPSYVTCAICRQRARSDLTVCPQCGRRLRTRRFPVGLAVLATMLVVGGLIWIWSALPSQWQATQASGQARIALVQQGLSELGGKVLDTASSLADSSVPRESPTPTPVVVLADLPAPALPSLQPGGGEEIARTNVVVAPTTVVEIKSDSLEDTAEGTTLADSAGLATSATVTTTPAASPQPTAQVALARSNPPTTQPTLAPSTPAATPTRVPPTATPTAVPPTITPTEIPPTATPTAVPPTATPTAVPPTATPTSVSPTAVSPMPTRLEVTPTPLPPAPTLAAPMATPTAIAVAASTGGGGLVYTVQPGDDWYTIAQSFGITMEALAAHNGQTPSSILQVHQKLRIPPSASPSPPPRRPQQPQPISSPVRSVPESTSLPAPAPLGPRDGDGFAVNAQPVLTWEPVRGLTDQDYYYVRVVFTLADGNEGFAEGEVTQPTYTVPRWVFETAKPPDRLSTWTVQVRRRQADEQVIELSPPSEPRTFYWR